MSKKNQLKQVIDQIRPRMMQVTPKGCSADRIAGVVLSEVQRNPKLLDCGMGSFATALMECARLGLEPCSTRGHVYLIPRGGQVTVQVGYKGLIQMAMRNGKVKSITANVFYKSEVDSGAFTASLCPASISHNWSPDVDKSKLEGAYARAELSTGQIIQVILDRSDIDRRKKKAMGGGKSGPWKDDLEAMARKSAIKALLAGGLVPLTAEDVIALEEAEEAPAPAPAVEENPLVLDVEEVKATTATERAMNAMQ